MNRSRIHILTLGSRGDVQPYIAAGKALKARGCDVIVSTGQDFNTLIEANGLRAAPLSIDMQALIETPEMKAAIHTFKGKINAWRSTKGLIQQQLDEMWSLARDVAPDLILYHPKAPVAPYLARALGAIAITSFLQPGFIPTGAFPPAFLPVPDCGQALNRLTGKAMSGLMALGQRAIMKPWLARHPDLQMGGQLAPLEGYHPSGKAIPRLHAYSRHVIAKPPEWAGHEHLTGAWFLDQSKNWPPDDKLVRFLDAGTPPVYIGFGSMPSADAAGLTRSVLEGVRRSGTRAILSTGWGALQNSDVPDNIHVLDAAPHDWLFPRCSAVVHHGGAGTTQEALRNGRPSLICPVFGDQPFWGKRIAALGAGPAPIPLKKLTADNLANALLALRDPSFTRNAEQLGIAMRDEAGAETAARLITELLN